MSRKPERAGPRGTRKGPARIPARMRERQGMTRKYARKCPRRARGIDRSHQTPRETHPRGLLLERVHPVIFDAMERRAPLIGA